MGLHRKRNDRNVRAGKHLAQGHPGTMVQAALRVVLHRKAMVLQGFKHQLGGLGAARGRVADLVQAGVESTKVVNGL